MEPTRWSRGNQICFIDNQAWGLTKGLTRVILGKESEIRRAIETGKPTGNNFVDNIIKEDTQMIP